MLDPKKAAKIIDAANKFQPNFCDIFIEENRLASVQYLDKKVKSLRTGTDFGVGIRMIFGDRVRYGYTNSLQLETLLAIVKSLGSLPLEAKNIAPISFQSHHYINLHIAEKALGIQTYFEEKIEYLKKIDLACRAYQAIHQVDGSVSQRVQKIEIFNSEGDHSCDTRNYTRISVAAIAKDGHKQARGHRAPGGLQGWKIAEEHDPEQLGDLVARQAVNVLNASPCPSGKMPVVLENGFGGVIFHEACGHLLETTSVEKKASVLHDQMGKQIAHSAISAVDDGTLGNKWGSINIDDEGLPAQKTKLIDKGILTAFLSDKIGEMKTGHPRTGSGRRESYKFPPASRMRNTYIEPGDFTKEDIIASIDHGIYAKAMGGGSVSPGTGDFNFAVDEAYLIENGKIGKAVRGGTLIGSGPKILPLISMVASNLELAAGMCGSVSGSVPVTVGQPTLKVDEILVGGVS